MFERVITYDRYLLECGSCSNSIYINVMRGIPPYPTDNERICSECGTLCKYTRAKNQMVSIGNKIITDPKVVKNFN